MCYFSNESCQVCKVLKPKIGNFLLTQYPKIRPLYIDISQHPELAATHSIFAVPTVLVFFEGKEFYRISRNIGIEELKRMIDRPYSLLFS
jgi:thioredoxin-like negative regulator of GroEL